MRLRSWLVLALIVVGWEALYRAGHVNPLLVPAPSLIVEAAIKDGPTFVDALRITAFEIVVAGALAWSIGVTAGVILGAELSTAVAISPFLSATIAVPLVVLYPVIVAMAGIGPPSKIIYGTLAGVFPIALTTVSGVSSIDRRYLVLGRALGANWPQMMVLVMSRLALPSIVSGLRVGTSLVIISVVQSEMLSATSGIGFLISYHRSLFHAGHVYLGILLIVVLAMIANALLGRIERWVV